MRCVERLLLVVMMLLGTTSPSSAAILVFDSFANSNNDQQLWNDGFGWKSGWSIPGDQTYRWSVENLGIPFSNPNVLVYWAGDSPAAKGIRVNTSSGSVGPISRPLADSVLQYLLGAVNRKIYVSSLVYWSSGSGGDWDNIVSLITFDIPNSSLNDDQRSIFIGMTRNVDTGQGYFYTNVGVQNEKRTSESPQVNTWYLLGATIEYLGGNTLASELWAIDQNATNWWKTEKSVATIAGLSDANQIRWRLSGRIFEQSDYFVWDELIIATSFEEAARIVPEPTAGVTASLILGVVALSGLCRKFSRITRGD